MKKRFPSVLLALCLCAGLCVPSFAAKQAPPLPTVTIDLPGGDAAQTETAEYQLRQFTVETKEEPRGDDVRTYDVYTYNEEPSAETLNVTPLPMGARIRIDGIHPADGKRFTLTLKAWSDPDGDGVYEERIFWWVPNFSGGYTSYTVLPLTKKGPFSEKDINHVAGYTPIIDAEGFAFYGGLDSQSSSSDELYECFGPNTLVQLNARYDAWSTDPQYERETLAYFLIGADGESDFTDVPEWCAPAVDWAVDEYITNGYGDGRFGPSDRCINAQILTFLWRAEGRYFSTYKLPVDITGKNLAYAENALRWAAAHDMVDGTLDPEAYCTRASAVNYIWQALGKESAPASSFADVPAGADYAAAVNWAVKNGIVEGYSDGSFQPDRVCSRGEIVTMLHRAYVPEARLPVGT